MAELVKGDDVFDDDVSTEHLVERIEVPNYIIEAEEIRSNIRLRLIFTTVLLSIFGLSVLLTYALIFLWGFGVIQLDRAFVHWLGAGTIGQTATMLVTMVRYLFPSRHQHDTPNRKGSTGKG